MDLKWVLLALAGVIVLAAAATSLWLRRRTRQEGWAGVLEQAPFGWVALEGPRRVGYANAAARRWLELESPGSLPEAEWADLLEQDRAALRVGEGAAGRHRSCKLKDRSVRWWVIAGARQDFVYLQEVTELVHAEQSGRFLLSDLSHELRTPLATLLTHLEVLRLPHISPEVRQQSVELMRAEAKRMTRLLHDLLELGRLETAAELERRVIDLNDLAAEVVSQLAPQAQERGLALTFQLASPRARVVGDPDRLRQVLLNLVDNALKYSRPGDQVEVAIHSSGGQARVSVQDTGPGIPAEDLPNVTRRFYRVAGSVGEGSGLGLALVQEILLRHSSRLELSSQSEGPQTGTCARFSLPLLPSAGEAG